jgi:hypothetical protein
MSREELVRYAACIEGVINSYSILIPSLEESAWDTRRRLVENTVLKWILKKYGLSTSTAFISLRIGSCAQNKEPWSSLMAGNVLNS